MKLREHYFPMVTAKMSVEVYQVTFLPLIHEKREVNFFISE